MGKVEPTVRAGHVQENLRSLAALGDERAAHARLVLPPRLVETIRAAARLDWLPTTYDQALFQAVQKVGGANGVFRVVEATMLSTFEQPLFSSLMEAAATIHLLERNAVLRLACAAYPMVHRNAGALRLGVRTGDAIDLLLVRAPSSIVSDETYMQAIGFALQTVHRLSRPAATVQAIVRDKTSGTVRFVCSDGDEVAVPQGLGAR